MVAGFEVPSLSNGMKMRQDPVRRYVARGASRYISSVRYRSLLSHLLCIALLIMAIFFLGYLYNTPDVQVLHMVDEESHTENKVEGPTICTSEVKMTLPLLREVYDDNMNKVLYVGPNTCSVISELLLDEDDYEAWGVEPLGSDSTDSYCWDFIHKGIVRVADMKFPLPYRERSFSHVIVSDTLEYMSSRYLNNTIPELMRVSREGVIIFAGYPASPVWNFTRYNYNGQVKFRSPSWWRRYLVQREVEENEVAKKRFKKILKDILYTPSCQILFLKSHNETI